MDLDAFRWLLTDEGQAVLARAVEATADAEHDELAIQAQLRRSTPADRVAAALTQVELRRRAVPKFGDLAARMYFTPDGLEQATRLSVATHRAARLAGRGHPLRRSTWAAGSAATCWRSRGPGITAAGVDLDPVRVAVAQANLAALGLDGAVLEADATTLDTSPFDVAFADPARRGGRGRTFHVDEWTPPWPFVEELLRRDACVKVAPGIPHEPRARRRGGRVGQRPRRGEGGRAVVGPAGHGRASRDRHRRRRAGHPDRRGRSRELGHRGR